MRRLLATTIAAACLFTVVARSAGAAATEDEAGLVAGINAIRTSRGLAPLEVHPELQLKAQAWAAHMAGTGMLAHSQLDEGITADWARLAENVGTGDTLDQTHETLLASPYHFANIVDPEIDHIGVGLASAGGRIYLAQEFMQLRTPTVAPTTATTTASAGAPPAAPPAPVVPKAAAPAPVSPPAPLETAVVATPAPPAAPVAEATPPTAVPTLTSPPVPATTAPAALPAPSITPVTHSGGRPAPAGTERSAGSAWVAVGLLLLVARSLADSARPRRRPT